MSELREFLAAYSASYQTYDPTQVAKFIHCPCIFFLRDDCILLDTDLKIIEFLGAGFETYRSNGCVNFNARMLKERAIGPRYALIDVAWSPENAAGKIMMNFSTTYNLVHDQGRWKTCTITRHDA